MFAPDEELLDIWRAEHYERSWHRAEAVKVFKRIRSDKLKQEAARIKKSLIEEKGSCKICGYSFKPVLQIHHILPISQGGNNDTDNIICVCPTCHKTLHYMYSCAKPNRSDGVVDAMYSSMTIVQNDGNIRLYDVWAKYLEMLEEVSKYKKVHGC